MAKQEDPLTKDIDERMKKACYKERKDKEDPVNPQFWLMLIIAVIAVAGLVISVVQLLK
ncbi:accessory secretory protein Asp4 [Limosilactobacillus fermentum]|uniref:accessory secretory protein Asp4 n=1 Tax=Limosilactobacillus fermentum TaxID=1613 RepID=UPI002F266833